MASMLREYISKKLSELGLSEELDLNETMENVIEIGKVSRSIGAASELRREALYIGKNRRTKKKYTVSYTHTNFFADGQQSNAELETREKEQRNLFKHVLNNLAESEDE